MIRFQGGDPAQCRGRAGVGRGAQTRKERLFFVLSVPGSRAGEIVQGSGQSAAMLGIERGAAATLSGLANLDQDVQENVRRGGDNQPGVRVADRSRLEA